MKLQNKIITTPVYLKTDKHMEWPKDKMFYLLSSDGLFLCRNHDWFRSCELAKRGPGELEGQLPFAEVNYPKIPKAIIEKAVGFFRAIEKKNGWESAVILVWNRQAKAIELVCPEQKCSWGGVDYEIPKLPQHLLLIGDIHSHPTFSPTPSTIDKDDEDKRPGLHIVAGYINRKEPEFYCTIVIDGERFEIKDQSAVMDPFDANGEEVEVPKEWLCKVTEKKYAHTSNYGGGDYYGGNWQEQSKRGPESKRDREAVEKTLKRFREQRDKPSWHQVKTALFADTRDAGYLWCENRAIEFMKEWEKAHETTTTE